MIVTPFKVDQNKKSKPFDRLSPESGKRRMGNMQRLWPRYAEKLFPQMYRDLFGDAMLMPIEMGTNMAAGNQPKHLPLSFATQA